jgi:YaiO family outer membrane protein
MALTLMIGLRKLNRIALLAALALSAMAGAVGAAAPERVAQVGLFPTGEADHPADRTFPRLKLTRGGGLGLALDALYSDGAGTAVRYTGTRNLPGAQYAQSVGGLVYPLSPKWFSTVETSSSASTRSYLGQLHRSLPGGFDMSVGLRYRLRDYGQWPAATPETVPLADRSWSLLPPALAGSGTAGYELRLNYRYGERNTLGLSYGSGPDSDYTRQLVGLQAGEGRQFGLTGEHWLTPDWAVNYGVMAQEQVGPSRGQGLRLGLRYRF